MNAKELLQSATEARKNKNWKEALKLYQKYFETAEATNEWDKYFYALTLLRNHKFQEALDVCRKLYKENKNFRPNYVLYSKSIYYTVLWNIDGKDIEIISKAIVSIKNLTGNDDDYFKFEDVFVRTLKQLLEKKKYDIAENILQLVDYQDFTKETKEIKKGKNKIELASGLENFLVYSTKLYIIKKNYKKALKNIDYFFDQIKKSHYQNHIWMKRMKAQVLRESGNRKEAIKLYFEITKTKHDWYLYYELGEILRENGQNEAGMYFLAKAIVEKQDVKYKIKLLMYLLRAKQNDFDKKNLVKLLCKLYEENNWRLPSEIGFVASEIKTDCTNAGDRGAMLRKLYAEAKKITLNDELRGNVIKKFSAFTGLVKLETNETLFFVSKGVATEVNDTVMCRIAWGYDFKKNKVKKQVLIFDKI